MVGRATRRKLQEVGIKTIGQLAAAEPLFLKSILKSHGLLIHDYANGIDHSQVTINDDVIQKGVGNGLTYAYDLETIEDINLEALALCERVGMRLRKLSRYASLVSVHLRNNSLRGYSHQVKLQNCINTTNEIYEIVKRLIAEMWRHEPIRAMSISVSEFSLSDQVQLSIFDAKDKEREEKLDRTVDEIRQQFGTESIFRATFAGGIIKPVQGGVNNGNYLMMGGYRL